MEEISSWGDEVCHHRQHRAEASVLSRLCCGFPILPEAQLMMVGVVVENVRLIADINWLYVVVDVGG